MTAEEIRRAKNREYRKRWYYKCKKAGICFICNRPTSKKESGERYTRCDECREKQAEKYRKEKIKC